LELKYFNIVGTLYTFPSAKAIINLFFLFCQFCIADFIKNKHPFVENEEIAVVKSLTFSTLFLALQNYYLHNSIML